jgi:hypothetical protein
LTLKCLKAQEIEMKFTNMYENEALQISVVKKWSTRFMLGKTKLGDRRRSGRPASSNLT